MNEIRISDKISYIAASRDPLSADIGIIRDGSTTWLFDVGNGAHSIAGLDGCYQIVLSHFHPDHVGNLDRLRASAVFGSKTTCQHVRRGTVVTEDLFFGGIHIFPIPSCHASGCLGLEVDGNYAFVGDALYCRSKNGRYGYNAQLLQQVIAVLKKLQAPCLLVSHRDGLIRSRDEVIGELESIYRMRTKNDPDIWLDAIRL